MKCRLLLKICGLMRPEDIRLCQQAGVNIIGLVTEYPLPVPWNISAERAAELMSLVQSPMQTCLVTGGTRSRGRSLWQNRCGRIICSCIIRKP